MRQVELRALIAGLVITSFGLGGIVGWRIEAARLDARSDRLPHSEGVGTIDPPSRPLPPYPGRTPIPPTLRGTDAQTDARRVLRNGLDSLIRTIRTKAAYRNSPADFSYFTEPRASDAPGLCEAFQIMPASISPVGFEMEKRYLVAGSFEPPPYGTEKGDVYRTYMAWKHRRDANCTLRGADESWFSVRGAVSPQGPQLLDGVVMAAKGGGALPFPVVCERPKQVPADPLCANPRKALAAIDPRDIGDIEESEAFTGDDMRLTVAIETRGDYEYKAVRIVGERSGKDQPLKIMSVTVASGFRIID